jgi:hypothetical protein
MTTDSNRSPQYQLGATSDEAEMENRVAKLPIPGPGDIANQLANQQWQFPRAATDSQISRDTHGLPNG